MCLVINYKYTPTNKVWDGVFTNHLVCPSVDQCSSKKETLKVFTSHTDCWWPEGVSWFWSKILWHAPSHRKEKLHNTCPAYTFSWRNIWSFYFTQRLLTTRWCDLIQGHLGKFRVTGRNSALFVCGLFLSYGDTFEVSTSHEDCLTYQRPEVVSWEFGQRLFRHPQGHCKKCKFLPRPYLVMEWNVMEYD